MTEFETEIEGVEGAVATVEAKPKRGRGRPELYSEQQKNHIRDLYDALGNKTLVLQTLQRVPGTDTSLVDNDLFPLGGKIPSMPTLLKILKNA